MNTRACGILLHITSLPGGTLDRSAYAFADRLSSASQSFWQVLPLNPVLEGNSPYFSCSVFAGGEHLIAPGARHEYGREFADFREKQSYWLNDYALFTALKRRDARPFWEWEPRFRRRDTGALISFSLENREELEQIKKMQYEFQCCWLELKKYANDKGISIIGDMPFYSAGDSADCWAHSELFRFDSAAGCPPDDFSPTGQLWGNPTYDFSAMERDGYRWWRERFRRASDMYDVIRVDHFRGFESFFSIPKGCAPDKGSWVKGPGYGLFKRVFEDCAGIRLIAEDLGYITPEVTELIERCGIPGTRVLEFAFDESMSSIYLPHNLEKNSVVYTGTHDNNTANGWFETADDKTKELFIEYSGKAERESAADAMLRLMYSSVSKLAVAPMQDVLNLTDARMNTPGTVGGKNWMWRMRPEAFDDKTVSRLKNAAWRYGRADN